MSDVTLHYIETAHGNICVYHWNSLEYIIGLWTDIREICDINGLAEF